MCLLMDVYLCYFCVCSDWRLVFVHILHKFNGIITSVYPQTGD